MYRLTTLAILGLSSVFIADSVTRTPEAEACGVKLVVKANKKPRKRLRAKARKRVIQTGGNVVAKRRRVNRKRDDRVRVASGPGDRQARSSSGASPRRPVTTKTRTRTIGQSPAADTKPARTNPARTRTHTPDTKPAKVREPKETKPPKEVKVARTDTSVDDKPRTDPKPTKTRPAPADLPDVSVEVYFGYNSFSVEPEAAASLEEVIQWLRDNPRGTLHVFGYADPAGSATYNKRLSARRARAVQRYLAKKAGVSVKRLRLVPRGEQDMAYPEDSPKNRRVVVKTR